MCGLDRKHVSSDDRLVQRLIAAFGVLGDLVVWGGVENVSSELAAGFDDSPWARPLWKPVPIDTPRGELEDCYSILGGEFPPLYERLVLSYRWLEIDLKGFVRLFANPPGSLTTGLLVEITSDRHHRDVLLPAGLLPFGRASGGAFDPVCFDTTRRDPVGDCPIVQINHEAMILHGSVKEQLELADTFRSFVGEIVTRSEELRGD